MRLTLNHVSSFCLGLSLLALPAGAQHQSAGSGNRPGLNPSGPRAVDILTFQSIAKGTIVSEAYGRFGAGPVLIQGHNPELGEVNAAVSFASGRPSGGDYDLGTPNIDFGGPGIGDGGSEGSVYQNDQRLGKVLIVAENLDDANNDGFVDNPSDADVAGSTLLFDFSPVGGATLRGLTVIDIEATPQPAVVEMLGPSGEVLNSVMLPIVGDNGLAEVDLGPTAGVVVMLVTLGGSAALDSIVFEPFAGSSVAGRVWNDLDDNGLQDAGEPGREGAVVTLLDSNLGPVATSTTDVNGIYGFSGLAAGNYVISVESTSLPSGSYPSPCNVGDDDSIDNDCVPLSFETGYVAETLDFDFGFVTPPDCNGAIGDLVFEDVNGNNIQDPGDLGIPGATMMLTDVATGMLLETQLTDADGGYRFEDLCPGEYAVSVDVSTSPFPPAGRPSYGPAICDIGDDTTIDSECGPECVVIVEFDTVLGTSEDLTIDWGFRECGDCSGQVNALSLRYNAPGPALVEIIELQTGTTVLAEVAEMDTILSFFPSQATFGTALQIFVDGVFNGEIHTSCSEPIFIGLLAGDLEVLAGTSASGGAFCAPGEGDNGGGGGDDDDDDGHDDDDDSHHHDDDDGHHDDDDDGYHDDDDNGWGHDDDN